MADFDYLLPFSQPLARCRKNVIPSIRKLPRTSDGLDRLINQVPNTYFARYVANLQALYGDKAVRAMMSTALRRAALRCAKIGVDR